MKILRILFLIPFFTFASYAQAQPPAKTLKAVKFGKLWDAKGKLWTNAIVVIEDDKFKSVTTNAAEIPAGETLPGLLS